MLPTFIEKLENATRQVSNFKADTTYGYGIIDDLKTDLEENCKTLRRYERVINNFRVTKKDAATEMRLICKYLEEFQGLIMECENLSPGRDYMWTPDNKIFS